LGVEGVGGGNILSDRGLGDRFNNLLVIGKKNIKAQ
jgi:hypothetical protein